MKQILSIKLKAVLLKRNNSKFRKMAIITKKREKTTLC